MSHSDATLNDDEDPVTVSEEEDVDDQERRGESEDDQDQDEYEDSQPAVHSAPGPESLASLLVDMTGKLQEERTKRGEVEKRNHSLLMELDQLQKEVLALRAASSVVTEGHCVESATAKTEKSSHSSNSPDAPPPTGNADDGEFCWKELLDAKKAKEKALAEAHQRAMQVMELNACISMQHDELTALRTRAREDREALEQSETAAKELRQERQLLAQETKLLRDNVEHLTTEMGKRGTHFKSIMEKWTEAQAQSEHRERENTALREQLQATRQHAGLQERELETLRDERDALQHQANQLKGAVAAKAAESKAFQAYGASAREHLQSQQAAIQRHAVYRRQVHGVARDAIISVHGIRATLAQTRAPLVAVQADFRRFLERLRAPVLALVERSSRFVKAAHAEHAPLRAALYSAELARRHLHEQLWRARRDALIICQLQNDDSLLEAPGGGITADDNQSGHINLRANYSNGELFLREAKSTGAPDNANEMLGVKCDAVFSDRAREWDRYESVTPLLQSVIDGSNACITTFVGAPPLRIPGSATHLTVPELSLRELFTAVAEHGRDPRFHRAKFTISFLAVYNETVFDLLGLAGTSTPAAEPNGLSARQIVVLEVQNAEEALMVLDGGREHVTPATTQSFGLSESRPQLIPSHTHTVVTICLTFESLLTGAPAIKSKLQIIELALGSGLNGISTRSMAEPLPWSGEPDSREEAKQRVVVEIGAEALVTALAEVRLKDVSFVRYHSSKLTVLLQDTIKPGAKFLALVALPVSTPHESSSTKCNLVAIMRVLQQIRAAVGGGEDPRMNCRSSSRDRSLEGFMNRLALQQTHMNNDLALPFSSLDMQEHARQRSGASISWGTELEDMTKRYGKETLESLDVAPASSQRTSAIDAGSSVDMDEQDNTPQQLKPMHPTSYSSSFQSPPSLSATTVRKAKTSRKNSKASRDQSAATSSKKQAATVRISPSRAGKSASLPRSASPPTAISSTFAPPSTMATVLKIRRETASSALKKTLLNKNLHDTRSPFR
ncbi:hypothetical protein PHYBOEH_007416 [Phytophthora boehmeriae]|uniref:Kinesin motor domain-containing protein n=1 Tax=Phytophthora boehmeriae TaxID=109152 RepID=A0A8T1WD55_9STRA|nr:hypothetical protein PHYBOEH_007416 [Phytophthora boehmeriae]